MNNPWYVPKTSPALGIKPRGGRVGGLCPRVLLDVPGEARHCSKCQGREIPGPQEKEASFKGMSLLAASRARPGFGSENASC